MKKNYLLLLLIFCLPVLSHAAKDDTIWRQVLKPQYFAGKSIKDGDKIIQLTTPKRAEDPALVPIKVTTSLVQTNKIYIKRIILLIDKNPVPLIGEFDFTPESGRADIAMRVRVNTYSYIRAIAEMNNGDLYMVKKFVKASGGCSAPIGADYDAAMQRLGKMKFRLDNELEDGKPTMAQLLISHPNVTGMQMDQVTRFKRRAHFIKQIKVTFNDQPILTAKTDIAISSDPNFRFYFIPTKKGVLKAEFTDTSCESPVSRSVCKLGKTYTKSYTVKP
ncbi:MAG: quinoprotein dehydrogenase-associated SoxYZ-like carrier [Gammaproteobacteria bacterium]|jgi:sulfur-oxidizing protein SoxY|nr:quinoprotein dehydrogenase-associated SoxYZ-like carrier [Gammaproteobacteria bacterium]MBT4145865.1 quinoprotein dehydrogenase-associated SoxYZ-like carrier [Gammaproteobacteria bacterium]MBT5221720.1 quinoprotein dehydrogenase-associated SoxYZ-like carrier [Gammaproteobacteria bacterium]MBT5826422.1 quinoprotein dehydrogenase-associated SoxYZ-like carrier [Gammaproteobacteria bacterium]MBT5966417.1 quinoprotein dehydrogenase-associated SoxYZ-like carrier [Gammaproteobacteria bacterium]